MQEELSRTVMAPPHSRLPSLPTIPVITQRHRAGPPSRSAHPDVPSHADLPPPPPRPLSLPSPPRTTQHKSGSTSSSSVQPELLRQADIVTRPPPVLLSGMSISDMPPSPHIDITVPTPTSSAVASPRLGPRANPQLAVPSSPTGSSASTPGPSRLIESSRSLVLQPQAQSMRPIDPPSYRAPPDDPGPSSAHFMGGTDPYEDLAMEDDDDGIQPAKIFVVEGPQPRPRKRKSRTSRLAKKTKFGGGDSRVLDFWSDRPWRSFSRFPGGSNGIVSRPVQDSFGHGSPSDM